MGESEPLLSRDAAREASRRETERRRERPRKVADSPEGLCVVVILMYGGGLRRLFRPLWLSGSGEDKADSMMSVMISVVTDSVVIANDKSCSR